MPVTAKLKELKIAPRKVRLVAELVRNKKVGEAQGLLRFTVKKACLPVLKLLNSAIANAKSNFSLNENDLYISKIFVDEGHKQRKFRARARGTASFIKKRGSHITIVLDTMKDSSGPKKQTEDVSRKAVKVTDAKAKKTKLRTIPKLTTSPKKGVIGTNNPGKIFRRKAF